MSALAPTSRELHRAAAAGGIAVASVLLAAAFAAPATAQTFGLDDLPAAPAFAPPGPIGGLGAEDPFALSPGPPLAPSFSLFFPPVLGTAGDGAWLSPGPTIQHPGPNGFFVASFSRDHFDTGSGIMLELSVDRTTVGMPGTAVGVEAAFGQAHGDIYSSTHTYAAPGGYVGLPPGPFVGPLPGTIVAGPAGTTLKTDESAYGLFTAGGISPAGVPVTPPILSPTLHDNLDSWDNLASFDSDGDGLFNTHSYFTLYPDEAFAVGLTPGDIVVVPAGDGGAIAVPYAPFGFMGLTPMDAVDGLVMYDNGAEPIPIAAGGPGFVEPGIDFALFSLAPGSLSLLMFGLDGGDVFFTDFTGSFGLYAPSPSLGLIPIPTGPPFMSDNVDALDVTHPCGAPGIATVATFNGSGINLDFLTATKVVVGGVWTATLLPQTTRGSGAWVILLRSATIPGFVIDLGMFFMLPPSGASELLLSLPAFIANFSPPAHGGGAGPPAVFSAPVPLSCALIGGPWNAQAVVLGDLPAFSPGVLDPWFSSAVGGVIGTF